MKKFLCLALAVMMIVFVLVGCGNDNKTESDMMSDVSQAITDAVDEAATMMDGINNGAVSDGDGIIGNEGNEDNNDNSSTSADDNSASDNGSDVTDSTALTDDLM